MSVVSERVAEKGLEFLDTAIKTAQNEAPVLVSQFLDYMLFMSLLEAARTLLWLFPIYVVWKIAANYIREDMATVADYESSLTKVKNEGVIYDYHSRIQTLKSGIVTTKAARNVLSAGITLIVVSIAIGSFKTVGKILIAPKVYLIQEAAALLVKPEVKESK